MQARPGSSRIITDSMRQKQQNQQKEDGGMVLQMQVIEEAQVEFDAEDLEEKAMIGNLLKRNYEREISDTGSNRGGERRASRQVIHSQIDQ